MIMVTYEQLKHGYILKAGDALVLHGIEYGVNDCFFLVTADTRYCAVFEKLDIKDSLRYASQFGEATQGGFPFMDSMESLTKLVIALYEEPEYKVGDYVTILPRSEFYDYDPIRYAEEMTKYEGKTYKVIGCSLRSATNTYKGVDTGDPHAYQLNEICYSWTSSMLRKATEEEIEKAKGKRVKSFAESDSMSGPIDILKKEIDDFTAKLKSRDPAMLDIPYPTWWGDKPSDTEIRLPKNEEETPHIKL